MSLELRPSEEGRVPWWNGICLEHPTHPVTAAAVFADKHPPDPNRLYVLFGAGGDYRVKALLDAGAVKPAIFEPSKAIYDAYLRNDKARYFTSIAELTTFVSGYPGADMEIVAPEEYMRAFPEAWQGFEQRMTEAEHTRRVRKNTFVLRGPQALKNVVKNIPLLRRIPPAPLIGGPVDGGTAFCVAAGPSLDKNAHLLGEARKRGYLFTASTVGPAVMLHHKQRVDFHVSIENVEQAGPLRACRSMAEVFLLDLTAHPDNFAAGEGGRTAYFAAPIPGADAVYRHVRAPIVVPYGASVATALPPLATRLGARRIVLIGQDLSYTGGRMYATGTGREDHTATVHPDHIELHRPDEFYHPFRVARLPAPANLIKYHMVKAWGGEGEIACPADMRLFYQNFAMFAQMVEGVELINATEGGIHIDGWKDEPLESVIARCEPRHDVDFDAVWAEAMAQLPKAVAHGAVFQLLDDHHRAAHRIRGAARVIQKDRDFERRALRLEHLYKNLISRAPLLDHLLAPSIHRVIDAANTPPEDKSYWIARVAEEVCTEFLDLSDPQPPSKAKRRKKKA